MPDPALPRPHGTPDKPGAPQRPIPAGTSRTVTVTPREK